MNINTFTEFDNYCMHRALTLAWKGRYTTSPNPRVGCVIVVNKQIIAEGYHRQQGGAHAEIDALNQIKTQNLSQATVYVTLEPCSHYGTTPPCVLALIERKVKRVMAAMQDPHPLVSGKGFRALKEAGVEVQYGLCEEKARNINQGFLSKIERHRPYTILKMALSLDGKIALKNGQSQWITSEFSRFDVQESRACSCAIMTGIGTILKDNSHLNVRTIYTTRQPIRIILDSQLRIPLNSTVIIDEGSSTWIVTLNIKSPKIEILTQKPHIKIIKAQEKKGRIDLNALLKELAKLGIGELYLECGATLAGSFIEENLVDELHLYQAPILLGNTAIDAFLMQERFNLKDTIHWKLIRSQQIENDIKLILKPQYHI